MIWLKELQTVNSYVNNALRMFLCNKLFFRTLVFDFSKNWDLPEINNNRWSRFKYWKSDLIASIDYDDVIKDFEKVNEPEKKINLSLSFL